MSEEFTGCENGHMSFERLKQFKEQEEHEQTLKQAQESYVPISDPYQDAPEHTIFTRIDDLFYKLTNRSIYEFDSSLVWATIAIPLIFSLVGLYYWAT